ncbi:MAG: hypothetical protein IPK58_09945 [Acidobacteria bacterium]|nr:hypothetical protein [Acidobacteriota bacterium]
MSQYGLAGPSGTSTTTTIPSLVETELVKTENCGRTVSQAIFAISPTFSASAPDIPEILPSFPLEKYLSAATVGQSYNFASHFRFDGSVRV